MMDGDIIANLESKLTSSRKIASRRAQSKLSDCAKQSAVNATALQLAERVLVVRARDSGIGCTYLGGSSSSSTTASGQSSTRTSPETAPVVVDKREKLDEKINEECELKRTSVMKDRLSSNVSVEKLVKRTMLRSTSSPSLSKHFTPTLFARQANSISPHLNASPSEVTPVAPAAKSHELRPVETKTTRGSFSMAPIPGDLSDATKTPDVRFANLSTHRVELPRANNSGRLVHKCEVCGKAFDRPSILTRHMCTHTNERPYKCQYCEKNFITRSNQLTHERIHTKEKPYVCPSCSKRFASSSNLAQHKLVHSKENRYQCDQCSSGFSNPRSLLLHSYKHTGQWPFRCAFCDKGFAVNSQRVYHEYVHLDEKPNKCPICQKSYARRNSLTQHMRLHEGSKASNEVADECRGSLSPLPESASLVPDPSNFPPNLAASTTTEVVVEDSTNGASRPDSTTLESSSVFCSEGTEKSSLPSTSTVVRSTCASDSVWNPRRMNCHSITVHNDLRTPMGSSSDASHDSSIQCDGSAIATNILNQMASETGNRKRSRGLNQNNDGKPILPQMSSDEFGIGSLLSTLDDMRRCTAKLDACLSDYRQYFASKLIHEVEKPIDYSTLNDPKI